MNHTLGINRVNSQTDGNWDHCLITLVFQNNFQLFTNTKVSVELDIAYGITTKRLLGSIVLRTFLALVTKCTEDVITGQSVANVDDKYFATKAPSAYPFTQFMFFALQSTVFLLLFSRWLSNRVRSFIICVRWFIFSVLLWKSFYLCSKKVFEQGTRDTFNTIQILWHSNNKIKEVLRCGWREKQKYNRCKRNKRRCRLYKCKFFL